MQNNNDSQRKNYQSLGAGGPEYKNARKTLADAHRRAAPKTRRTGLEDTQMAKLNDRGSGDVFK